MRKRARKTKGGKRRGTLPKRVNGRFVARSKSRPRAAAAAPAPKARTRTRTVTKIRYYSKPRRIGKIARRSMKGRRARSSGRIGAVIGAAVAGAAIGAMIGSVANEAGLLNSVPAQNKLGISATGIVGIGLIVIGIFTKSEGMKLLFYGLGGGLVIEEVTRQIDMRFYDFRVAFMGAPALDYAQGISGAQVQLAQMAQAPSQLPQAPPSQGRPAGNAATAPRGEPRQAPPAPGPGEEFANRPSGREGAARSRETRRDEGRGGLADRGERPQPPPRPTFQNEPGEALDPGVPHPGIASRGMDYDPSSMYRYALRIA